MNALPLTCCTIALMAVVSGVPAQTETRSTGVYRCGPEGRDLRDSPCPDGKAGTHRAVEYEQPASAAQREALQRQRADAKRARELERERQRFEASHPKGGPVGIDGLARPEPVLSKAEGDKPPSTKKPKTKKPKRPKSSAASAPR
ncbi:hypothetical protein [Paucibacter sp. XJ19-41]|uniref:hypothetical protein n=1 Tax=Paucibacter sp. XJ19-41 TaxID=2927824 RepID=UPI002349AF39|nr:hypothetical protein [Paucibacter sp. XJ19-41]MDC6167767.1 hypothetical protein [Paucibacter sp. XJ19-41]